MNDNLTSRQAVIEAIDVLKRNYPSSCFEDLCKAVDIAIKVLSEQLKSYEKGTDNQMTVCPMCPNCPDNCPLDTDMRKESGADE